MIHEHNYDKDEYQARKWQHKLECACIETFPEDVSQIVLVCYFKVPWKYFSSESNSELNPPFSNSSRILFHWMLKVRKHFSNIAILYHYCTVYVIWKHHSCLKVQSLHWKLTISLWNSISLFLKTNHYITDSNLTYWPVAGRLQHFLVVYVETAIFINPLESFTAKGGHFFYSGSEYLII